jgi:hypothetical protein
MMMMMMMMMMTTTTMTTTATETTTVRVQNLGTKALSFCPSLFNQRLPYESEHTVAPKVRRLPLTQWGI